MDQEPENNLPSEIAESRPMVRRRRKKRRIRKKSLRAMLKKGVLWGISIGIALLAIIFAIISYNW